MYIVDLEIANKYLSIYLKEYVYKDLAQLKDNISTHARNIPKGILQNVTLNLNKRPEKLIIAKGRHMEHLL